jgi:hypothetical protein
VVCIYLKCGEFFHVRCCSLCHLSTLKWKEIEKEWIQNSRDGGRGGSKQATWGMKRKIWRRKRRRRRRREEEKKRRRRSLTEGGDEGGHSGEKERMAEDDCLFALRIWGSRRSLWG